MRLKPGDKVAIVSPSRPVPSLFPEVANKGIENIRKYFDLDPEIFPHAFDDIKYSYEHPDLRAKDINDAFGNPEIKAVISTIGGDESIRILEHLNREMIIRNPKIFMGFSDCTTITTYLAINGMASIYGGAVMAGFAQMDHFPKEFAEYWKSILFDDSKDLTMKRFRKYSQGYPDWRTSEDPGAVKEIIDSNKWNWINGSRMEGKIFAANIEVLDWMRGTRYFPELSFFSDKILLLETSEEIPSPLAVERMIRNLEIIGVIDLIRGLAFGRFRGYTEEMQNEANKRIERMIKIEFKDKDIPVVGGLGFGHTDPYFPIPNGIPAVVEKSYIQLKESFTTN